MKNGGMVDGSEILTVPDALQWLGSAKPLQPNMRTAMCETSFKTPFFRRVHHPNAHTTQPPTVTPPKFCRFFKVLREF
jgi:hypothetical protein